MQDNLNLDEGSTVYFQEEFQRTIRETQEKLDKAEFENAKRLAFGAYHFYNKNKLFISDKKAFIGLIILGKAFFNKNKDKEAEELFSLARSIAPKEDYSEAHFYLLWPAIVDNDIVAVKKAIDKNELQKNFDKFDSKLQYWIARAEEKIGDPKIALGYYDKIISNSPYSFYSIMALKDVARLKKGELKEEDILAKLIAKDDSIDLSIDKISELFLFSLKRYAVWSKLGFERFQALELRHLQTLTIETGIKDEALKKTLTNHQFKTYLLLNLVKLLNAKKRFITALKIFQDSVDQNSLTLNINLLKQIFPLSFLDIIKKNSSSLDPLIVISLIRQESAFNPDAMSGVGAKGLMQLMLPTAKRFNQKVKMKNLLNPEINVAIGTKYLRQLITRYDGNLIFALASYNAGENRIDKWRKEIFRSAGPLSIIESIPFEETRNYVKLIYRNYFFYSIIQNKSLLNIPLEDSFKHSLPKH